MECPFDILKVPGGADARWVEAVSTLSAARKRIEELMVHTPCEYIIFDQRTQEKIMIRPE